MYRHRHLRASPATDLERGPLHFVVRKPLSLAGIGHAHLPSLPLVAGLLARELSLVVLPRRARAIKNINSNSIVAGTFLGQRQPQLDIGSLCLYFSLRLGLLRGLLLHLLGSILL